MRFPPIVHGLNDDDLYKKNMGAVFLFKHSDLYGEYKFVCRNADVVFTEEMFEEIQAQIDCLCNMRYTEQELAYLRSIRYIPKGFVEFLRFWHPMRDYITCSRTADGKLDISIAGPLFSCMQFEIYILEIVNEVYFRMSYDYDRLLDSALERAEKKIRRFEDGTYSFSLTDFGTRRRLSYDCQRQILSMLPSRLGKNYLGTSNVRLSEEFGTKPRGTQAHEFFQVYQGIPSVPLAYTNHYAMIDWYDVFRGDNGIALTDTLTTPLFLLDFDKAMASTYAGVRHDSGDPFTWGERMIRHYEKLGIDPASKSLFFSDSLDFDRAQKICDHFRDKINVSFGIGTFVTNDTFAPPLNIVIKLQAVNGRPVAKLSDDEGKTLCQDAEYLAYLEDAIAYRLRNV